MSIPDVKNVVYFSFRLTLNVHIPASTLFWASWIKWSKVDTRDYNLHNWNNDSYITGSNSLLLLLECLTLDIKQSLAHVKLY